jgi:hypothetical protein
MHATGGSINKQLERMFKRLKDMLRNSPYRGQEDPYGPGPSSKPAAAGRPRRKRRQSGREAA